MLSVMGDGAHDGCVAQVGDFGMARSDWAVTEVKRTSSCGARSLPDDVGNVPRLDCGMAETWICARIKLHSHIGSEALYCIERDQLHHRPHADLCPDATGWPEIRCMRASLGCQAE